MVKITLKIDGMMCGMCEAHVNDAIRNSLCVKKVTSSHKSGETVIIAENEINESLAREAVEKQGYKLLAITSAPYDKKGFFAFLKKK